MVEFFTAMVIAAHLITTESANSTLFMFNNPGIPRKKNAPIQAFINLKISSRRLTNNHSRSLHIVYLEIPDRSEAATL